MQPQSSSVGHRAHRWGCHWSWDAAAPFRSQFCLSELCLDLSSAQGSSLSHCREQVAALCPMAMALQSQLHCP